MRILQRCIERLRVSSGSLRGGGDPLGVVGVDLRILRGPWLSVVCCFGGPWGVQMFISR